MCARIKIVKISAVLTTEICKQFTCCRYYLHTHSHTGVSKVSSPFSGSSWMSSAMYFLSLSHRTHNSFELALSLPLSFSSLCMCFWLAAFVCLHGTKNVCRGWNSMDGWMNECLCTLGIHLLASFTKQFSLYYVRKCFSSSVVFSLSLCVLWLAWVCEWHSFVTLTPSLSVREWEFFSLLGEAKWSVLHTQKVLWPNEVWILMSLILSTHDVRER